MGSMFTIFFKGPVAGAIESAIYDTLKTTVPAATNYIIFKMDGVTAWNPKQPNWMLDWQTAEAFSIDKTSISGGFQGLFFDSQLGEEKPNNAVPSMPMGSHPEKFQNYISTFTVNSFLSSMTEVMDPQFWLRAEQTGFTCELLNSFLYGIKDKYGDKTLVDVHVIQHEIGNFQVFDESSEMKLDSTFDLEFWVHTSNGKLEKAASLALIGGKFGASLLTKDMTLTVQVS